MLIALTILAFQQVASPPGPEPARPRPHERVQISVTGGQLSGTFIDAGRGTPGVLLFHMCDPNAVDGWAPVAERLAAIGVSSLAVAYRGYGPSRGQTTSVPGDQRFADADAMLAYLRSRVGATAPVGVTGSSCGVEVALRTAMRHPDGMRAVVVIAGPHSDDLLEHVRKTPGLAVFSGSSEGNRPAPDWAQALKAASRNPASQVRIPPGSAHGTEIFRENPAFAVEIADWLVERLKK